MAVVNYVINSRYLLWLLLAFPSIPFVFDFIKEDKYYSEMMYETGVLSTQLLVFTLSITPMTHVLKLWSFGRYLRKWLLQRRRYFGVASFGYAFIHLLLYIRETEEIIEIYEEALSITLGFGWIAFLIFIPLAVTSNNYFMKLMGKRWKQLQRFAYFAAIATFVHWITLGIFLSLCYQWIALLVIAKVIHLSFYILRRQNSLAY